MSFHHDQAKKICTDHEHKINHSFCKNNHKKDDTFFYRAEFTSERKQAS